MGYIIPGTTNGPEAAARFTNPSSIARYDQKLYVADKGTGNIRKISILTLDVTTIATGLTDVEGLVTDSTGNLYVAATGLHKIYKIDVLDNVTLVAGSVQTATGSSETVVVGQDWTSVSATRMAEDYFISRWNKSGELLLVKVQQVI